jgi:hypothetical protein
MAQLGAATTWCTRASSTHTTVAAGTKAAQHVDAGSAHHARGSERPLLLLLLLLLLHLLLLLCESKKTGGRAQEGG